MVGVSAGRPAQQMVRMDAMRRRGFPGYLMMGERRQDRQQGRSALTLGDEGFRRLGQVLIFAKIWLDPTGRCGCRSTWHPPSSQQTKARNSEAPRKQPAHVRCPCQRSALPHSACGLTALGRNFVFGLTCFFTEVKIPCSPPLATIILHSIAIFFTLEFLLKVVVGHHRNRE